MTRKLTTRSSLESLRKEARRWLTDLRAGDTQATERFHHWHPGASHPPRLRDVQHALAREHGLGSWSALKTELAVAAATHGRPNAGLDQFLEHACLHYGIRPETGEWDEHYFDEPSRWRYATRILARRPDLARASVHVAAVTGDLAAVERFLQRGPAAVREKGGVQQWEPLQYVCYGRLPLPAVEQNSLTLARRLIEAGAAVSTPLATTQPDFLPLTGVIGQGEFAQHAHPQAVALAELLIDYGADPFDPQALYNTSLAGDEVFWLDFLFTRSDRRAETSKWTQPLAGNPHHPGMLDYLLGNAVSRDAGKRIDWLLSHGADPNTFDICTHRGVHTQARLLGFAEAAQRLKQAGARTEMLSEQDTFKAACAGQQLEKVRELATSHPEYRHEAAVLILAADPDGRRAQQGELQPQVPRSHGKPRPDRGSACGRSRSRKRDSWHRLSTRLSPRR